MNSQPDHRQHPEETRKRLGELAKLFLTLGFTSFGGPAAHIAMMNREIVEKRKWLDLQTFLDLISAANLIPGPNSTEVAIHIGYRRAGWKGLVVAGVSFIVPAVLLVLLFAVLYVQANALPTFTGVLYTIKPVIVAIVLHALWGFSKSALKQSHLTVIGLAVLGLLWAGGNEIVLLVAAGTASLLYTERFSAGNRLHSFSAPLAAWFLSKPALGAAAVTSPVLHLFFQFVKIGSVLYGSGYVLLAFLESEFVEKWGVLTPQQLLDAVAIGQFTPGPVFTTATFVGYLAAGFPGAIAATVGIFLPAFLFVALTAPWLTKLRQSKRLSAFLDGVNAASLSLMAYVSWKLATAAVVDGLTTGLAAVSLFLLFRYSRLNSAWLVGGAAVLGWLYAFL